MKNGFTLIELIAVIIVIGVLSVIIVPIAQKGLDKNAEDALQIQKENIEKAAKDWSLKNVKRLPGVGYGPLNIKLGQLKSEGYLPVNLKNPKTSSILSDESYVMISNNSGDYEYDDYEYDVYLYDIPNQVNHGTLEFNDLNGVPWNDELEISDTVPNYDISVTDDGGTDLEYSKQYILNNKEVSEISTSKNNTYSVIYTVLYEGNIYKAVRSIIIK